MLLVQLPSQLLSNVLVSITSALNIVYSHHLFSCSTSSFEGTLCLRMDSVHFWNSALPKGTMVWNHFSAPAKSYIAYKGKSKWFFSQEPAFDLNTIPTESRSVERELVRAWLRAPYLRNPPTPISLTASPSLSPAPLFLLFRASLTFWP